MEDCKLQQNEAEEGKQETTIVDQSMKEQQKTKRHKARVDESKKKKLKTEPGDGSEVEKPKTKPIEDPWKWDEEPPNPRFFMVLDDTDRKFRKEAAQLNGLFHSGAIYDTRGLEGPLEEDYKNYLLLGYGADPQSCTESESETESETDTVEGGVAKE